MSKSNYIKNKDGTVVVALDYGISWDYEDAIKEFPVGSYVILGNMNREICRYHGFRGEQKDTQNGLMASAKS